MVVTYSANAETDKMPNLDKAFLEVSETIRPAVNTVIDVNSISKSICLKSRVKVVSVLTMNWSIDLAGFGFLQFAGVIH